VEGVRFVGTRMLEQRAHAQLTCAVASTHAQTDLAEVLQFSTWHCIRWREGEIGLFSYMYV
jgi:hypothetical protein